MNSESEKLVKRVEPGMDRQGAILAEIMFRRRGHKKLNQFLGVLRSAEEGHRITHLGLEVCYDYSDMDYYETRWVY